jgi:hypothetical protein
VPSSLAEEEELNTQALDDLKRAIDDLKIINVETKPEELIAGLKSGDDLLNDDSMAPFLQDKGFYPYPARDRSGAELLSDSGEVRVQTDDGIEYILRFGRTAGVEEGADEAKLNRYLLVSARVVDEHFQPKPPETEPMTESPPETPPAGAGGQDGEPGEAGDAGEDEPPAEDPPPSDEPADEPADEDPPATDDPPAVDNGEKPATTPPSDPELEELAKKRKEAEEKVAKLNDKFADWYYIISEDVYKKLHLGRFDIIKEKGDSSFGLDELEGLPGELPDTSPPSEEGDPPSDDAAPSDEPE